EYLAIFLADAPSQRNEEKAIEIAGKFVQAHPDSKLLAEVRMKLGEIYFRREDFANARTNFELIARESPGSPLAEPALFLAWQAAARSMNAGSPDRALELFEEVVKYNGTLKFYA